MSKPKNAYSKQIIQQLEQASIEQLNVSVFIDSYIDAPSTQKFLQDISDVTDFFPSKFKLFTQRSGEIVQMLEENEDLSLTDINEYVQNEYEQNNNVLDFNVQQLLMTQLTAEKQHNILLVLSSNAVFESESNEIFVQSASRFPLSMFLVGNWQSELQFEENMKFRNVNVIPIEKKPEKGIRRLFQVVVEHDQFMFERGMI